MEKSCRKCAPKLVPNPFLILMSNQKQPLYARNNFKNKKYWKIVKKS